MEDPPLILRIIYSDGLVPVLNELSLLHFIKEFLLNPLILLLEETANRSSLPLNVLIVLIRKKFHHPILLYCCLLGFGSCNDDGGGICLDSDHYFKRFASIK